MGKPEITPEIEVESKLKRERTMNPDAVILTVEEVNDPKNASKIAHKSCNAIYFRGEHVAYSFSGKTESAMRKEAVEKLKQSK